MTGVQTCALPISSDASTDATDEIVTRFADHRVRLVRSEENKGKEHAQWLAIQTATTPLLVFTDTATRLQPANPINWGNLGDALWQMPAAYERKVLGMMSL